VSAPFLSSEATVSRARLRGKAYRRLTRGIYVPSETPQDVRTLARAAVLAFPGAILCGPTAAELQRLPVEADAVVHVCLGQTAPRTTRAEVRVHRLDIAPDETMQIDGLTVTSGPRTLADLAPRLALDELVAVADVVARRYPRDEIEAAVAAAWGRPGVVRLRDAVPLANPGADSPAETRARLRLHRAGFTRMRHGVVVRDEAGEWLAAPDLADPVALVAVQHEGAVHFEAGIRQRRHDMARDELTRAMGWEVVISTALDDAEPERMIRNVMAAYSRSAERHGAHVLPTGLLRRHAA
jgi:hypothetical protein